MSSPLGKYAPVVAAITCGGVIAVYLMALVFGHVIAVEPQSITQLHDLAILAFGAVVGSAVAVNGWKQPVEIAHRRIDAIEEVTGISTHPVETPPDHANS